MQSAGIGARTRDTFVHRGFRFDGLRAGEGMSARGTNGHARSSAECPLSGEWEFADDRRLAPYREAILIVHR